MLSSLGSSTRISGPTSPGGFRGCLRGALHMRRPRQEFLAVRDGEVWRELRDAAHVQLAIAEHREQYRMAPRRPRDGDAGVGLVLREVQHLGAVREHRGRFADVEPACVHFGDVRDEHGLDAP